MKIFKWLFGGKTSKEGIQRSENILSTVDHATDIAIKKESAAMIKEALDIIGRQVVLSPVFQVKDSGDAGPVMEAASLLKQATSLEPHNASLHYAYVGALRLAAQFKTADEENAKLIGLHPDYALARFSSEAWKAGSVIAPSPFAFPEWTAATATLPDFFAGKLHTSTLFPTREGVYPRAVLFEKDGDGWWTKDRLKNVKSEVAVVLVPGSPNIAALYRICSGPGLTKPDMQEALVVLDAPKGDLSLIGWEYLVEADSLYVVVVDRRDKVVLNQRVAVTPETKATLGRVRDILLRIQGREISSQEMFPALQRYQSGADLDDIERRYFRK